MQEIRRIIFSKSELFSAFSAYAKKTPNFLPAGNLLYCVPIGQIGAESKVRARVETIPGDPSKEIDVIFYGEDAVEPLIFFCLENGIVLPREGRKTFLVVEGEANLVIELDLDFGLVFEELPPSKEHIDRIREAIRS